MLLAVAFLVISSAEARYQYQTDFTAEDFRQRREVVYDAIGSNIAIIQGAEDVQGFIVFNSGTSSVRDSEEMAGCVDESPGDNRTTLFRIDVIEIPIDDPSKARIVASPAVFADAETGNLAGLWKGDGQLEFRSYFKLPAPQAEQENGVAHNGSIVPVPSTRSI